MTREQLMAELTGEGYLRTPLLVEAFREVDRKDFVPAERAGEAYGNYPLPIGWGQTISQPIVVAFMLELLDVEAGNKVMEVGTGSGWQTALLAYLVGENGKVMGIECVPELKMMTVSNLNKYRELAKRARISLGDGSKGIPQAAPFDRIIAAAAANSVPPSWLEQLGRGGVLVAPVQNSVIKMIKGEDEKVRQEEYPGFAFVPLVSRIDK